MKKTCRIIGAIVLVLSLVRVQSGYPEQNLETTAFPSKTITVTTADFYLSRTKIKS